ncbi:MAG: hypothetical protein M3270_10355 [Thermoproteota archaeon]|nr:hypothetical protein [Thermoproteota archaeon]
MNLKQKMLSVIAAHPRAITFGLGLAIATALAIGLGSVDTHQAFAWNFNNQQNW